MTTPTLPTPAAKALQDHLRLLGKDPQAWLALFGDDAVIEFPYSAKLGLPTEFRGKDAIAAHINRMVSAMHGLEISQVVIYPAADPSLAFAEFHAEALVGPGKHPYSQDYIAYAQVKDGKIARYREYWDPIRVQGAVGTAATQNAGAQA